MATKDITDAQVVRACVEAHAAPPGNGSSLTALAVQTKQPPMACIRAMERAEKRGLIGYGVSLRTAWAEPKGKALLAKEAK